MSITITNPNNFTMLNVNFDDMLDSKLMASAVGSSSTCGGSLSIFSNEVILSGGVVPAFGSCTVAVVVSGVGVGVAPNSVTIKSSNTPDVTVGPVSVTLMGALVATKTFSPATVASGQNVTGTLVLRNTNSQNATGVSFVDTIPSATVANLTVVPSTGCPTMTRSSGTLTVSNQVMPSSTTCTYTFTVIPLGGVFGLVTNPNVTITTSNAVNSTMPAVSFFIMQAPIVSKSYSVGANIALGQITNLTITLQNPNTQPMLGVNLVDAVPTWLSFFPGE